MSNKNISYYINPYSQGQKVKLTKLVGSGAEGDVWATNGSGYVAKIYKNQPEQEKVEKLEVMLANPPKDPTSHQNHTSIAWIKELLYDDLGRCVGYLMPTIDLGKEIFYVYNSYRRKSTAPTFNWHYLHVTALNTALIFNEIHAKNYVIGDVNQRNILVKKNGMVSIIDTDSFQVTNPKTQKVYRCDFLTPEFVPPELFDKDLSKITQTRFHDRFRLGVIIYLLLFSGDHPFQGVWKGKGNPPTMEDNIKNGYWVAGNNGLIEPSQNTIPLDIVHPEIKRLFLKCFDDGHSNPSKRPSAEEWYKALQTGVDQLEKCSHVANHIYSKTYGSCYWCERNRNLGIDIFSISPTPKPSPNPTPKPSPPNPNPNYNFISKLQLKFVNINNNLNYRLLLVQLFSSLFQLVIYGIPSIIISILTSVLKPLKPLKKVKKSTILALLPFMLLFCILTYVVKAGVDFYQTLKQEDEKAKQIEKAQLREEQERLEAWKEKLRKEQKQFEVEKARQQTQEKQLAEEELEREQQKIKRENSDNSEQYRMIAVKRQLEIESMQLTEEVLQTLYYDRILDAHLVELTPDFKNRFNRLADKISILVKKNRDQFSPNTEKKVIRFESTGVLINKLLPRSRGGFAGLADGDIITSINGKRVRQVKDVVKFVRGRKRTLNFSIKRGNENVIVNLEL